METKKRRNNKTIGFSEEEYAFLIAKSKKMKLYPRQAILNKMGYK